MNPRSYVSRRGFMRASVAGTVGWQLNESARQAVAIQPIPRSEHAVLKLSLAAYSLRPHFGKDLDLAGFLDYCAQLDLEGAELTQYYFDKTVSRKDILQLKRHAHLAGIDVSGGAIGNNFSVEPGEALDAQMDYVQTWIDHYADLGAPVIRVFAGKPAEGVSEDQATERVISAMKTACDLAGKRGVILAIENHDFTTNIDRLMQIVESIESPWFGINLDTGNLEQSEDPYADMARMAPYAVNAQVKVKIRQASGHVDTDLERVVDVLRDANYSGYVVLEYEEEEAYENIPKYVDRLRKLIE